MGITLIRYFEVLVGVLVAILGLGVLVFAAAIGAGGMVSENGPSGPFAGLIILVVCGAYVVFIGGLLSLLIGIYHNTSRTADAVEKLLLK